MNNVLHHHCGAMTLLQKGRCLTVPAWWRPGVGLEHPECAEHAADVHGGIHRDTVFMWGYSTSRATGRPNMLDWHEYNEYLSLTVLIHDLVTQRVFLNLSLVCSIA